MPTLSIDWELSPRIIIVDAPDVEISAQEIVDTLRDAEDDVENTNYEQIVKASGKEDLGGGTLVGITVELQNAKIGFKDRTNKLEDGTVTTPDTTGVVLTDSTALFVTNNVAIGDLIVNTTDGSHASVTEVTSETSVKTTGLAGGTDNQFASADAYEVWEIFQCKITGGNTVAIDSGGSSLDPVFPTFGTQVVISSSSSATLAELGDIQHASFDGGIHVDVTSAISGTAYPAGNSANPVNNWPDAVVIDAREGFNKYFVEKSTTLDNSQDFTDATFEGKSIIDTVLTIPSGTTLSKAEFFNVSIEGALGDTTIIQACFLGETNPIIDVRGVIEDCSIGPSPITLGGTNASTVRIVRCNGAGEDVSPPTINGNGDGPKLDIQDYSGALNLANKTGSAFWDIQIDGNITIESTCTEGIIRCIGTGVLVDNSSVGCTVVDKMLDPAKLTDLHTAEGLSNVVSFTRKPNQWLSSDGEINVAINRQQSMMTYGAVTETRTRQAAAGVAFAIPLSTDLLPTVGTLTPTFTRASTGTYFDGSLIQSSAIDTPRFESGGLLIEESRENLCVRSQELNTTWVQDNVTINADAAVAPDGTTTADEVDEGTNFGFLRIYQTCTISGGSASYTVSAFFKDVDRRYALIGLNRGSSDFYCTADLQSGVITDTGASANGTFEIATIEAFPNDWYKVSVSGTTGEDTTAFPIIRSTNSATGTTTSGVGQTGTDKTFYAWGAQLEAGSLATSYIPTVASTVTRSADFLNYDSTTLVTDLSGSLIAEVRPLFSSTTANDGVILNIADQLVGPLYITDDTTQKIAIGDDVTVSSYDPTFVRGTLIRVASRWSGTVMQAIAGGNAGTEAVYDGDFTRGTNMNIGSDGTGNHFNGHIGNIIGYSNDRGEDQLKVDTG